MIKSLFSNYFKTALVLLFSNLYLGQVGISETLDIGSQGPYFVPCGVTKIKVEVWAGGGGSGDGTDRRISIGGGGGGGYSSVELNVSAGDSFNYSIGRGGRNGISTLEGQTSWFHNSNFLVANGGKGSSNNSRIGGLGGAISTVIPISNKVVVGSYISRSGGKGGNADTGWFEDLFDLSGGGGAAGDSSGNGQNGNDGGNGGLGKNGAGSGGNGRYYDYFGGNNSANPGVNPGGGAGGVSINRTGINGASGGNGRILITILSYSGNETKIITGVGNVKQNISCSTEKVQLEAQNGEIGDGVSTLWYKGNGSISIPFAEEMMEEKLEFYSNRAHEISVGNRTTGNINFLTTGGDPSISLTDRFVGSTTPIINSTHKYIIIRYRINSIPNTNGANQFEIYYKKQNLELDELRKVSYKTINDGLWHIASIDMSVSPEWSNDTLIEGVRFDISTKQNVNIDIDYLMLASHPVIDNTNSNDIILEVNPIIDEDYKVIRVADEHRRCNGSVNVTPSYAFNVQKVIKTFNAALGNWNVPSNWLTNSLPQLDKHCVIISSGKSAIINIPNAEAYQVKVQNGGKLTIQKDQTLKIKNQLIVEAGGGDVIFENNSNLLQVDDNAVNSGAVTVNRESKMKRLDYTFWSSPVAGQTLKSFSPGTLNARFMEYKENDDLFYGVANVNSQFSKAKGYAIRAFNSYNTSEVIFNGQFIGVPHNGLISASLSYTPVVSGVTASTHTVPGYNLVGNPYPSNISFNELYNNNTANIEGVAYFWTNFNPTPTQQGTKYSGNNYAVYNLTGGAPATGPVKDSTGAVKSATPNGSIAVGQGFMVKAKKNGSLNFSNKMRVKENGHFFPQAKMASTGIDRFWLRQVVPTGVENLILIGYLTGASDDFEWAYDAPLMAKGSDAIYSILDENSLVIQGKSPKVIKEDKILIGVNHFSQGNYTIGLGNVEGIFAKNQEIYLKDLHLNIISNLSKGDYTYYGEEGEFTNRFEIVFMPESTLNVVETKKNGIIVYSNGDYFDIKSSDSNIQSIELYSMTGALVKKLTVNSKLVQIQKSNLSNGVYLVKVISNNQVIVKKIINN